MQSDSDSKRAASEGPALHPLAAEPPPAHKAHYVAQRRLQQMQPGDTWYIVARTWYRRWEAACLGVADKAGPIDEKDLGPVDNTPLLDRDANLVSNLTEGIDVEFVPWDVWKAFTTWSVVPLVRLAADPTLSRYGPATHPLPRSVIARGRLGEPSLELRPPRLKALSLVDSQSDGPIGPPHNYVTLSIKDTVSTLSRELLASVSAPPNVPYRIWKIQPGDYAGSQFPASKLAAHGAELLQIDDKTIEDALIDFDDPFVVEFQHDGKWLADQTPTVPASTAPSVPPPLFSENSDFFSRLTKRSATTSVSQIQPRQVPSPAPSAASSTKAQDSQLAPFKSFAFSKTKAPQEPGTLGLGNMYACPTVLFLDLTLVQRGNTCFMNSALQCLAHTKELSDYFLCKLYLLLRMTTYSTFIAGVYQNELNPDNPLGMGGAIAEAFGALLHRIWAKDSTASSYSPREFKMQLQRFAPQFSGYQQHDSQELVAFLLDGLHEDLNRVLKKPYVEKPDWEGGGDLELAQFAQKSWHGYMQRNDSVIVDLFQGQYQSTLVCPECDKVC